MKRRNTTLQVSLVLLCVSILIGCEGGMSKLAKVADSISIGGGPVKREHFDSAKKVVKAGVAAKRTILPEEEYYISRAVGATVVSAYKPYDNEKATRYINVLGQTLAAASDKPYTFGGYRFLILDTDEVNAFAAPTGHIFVSRGMLRCCKSEDAVAAVLAHEIGHVQLQHGMQTIKKSRLTSFFTIAGTEAIKTWGGKDLAEATKIFEGTIDDVTQTLVTKGYSRASEGQADAAAVEIMKRVGYDPNALIDMLTIMKGHLKRGIGFAKTHPSPDVRIKGVKAAIGACPVSPTVAARQKRFEGVLEGI